MFVLLLASAHVSGCLIQRDARSLVGTPTDSRLQTTYSCVVSDNCNCDYDVHVIGNYESSNGRHGWGIQRTAGVTQVQLCVTGQSSKPLVLVFVSYEPVIWRLSIPTNVVVDKVLLVSWYHDIV